MPADPANSAVAAPIASADATTLSLGDPATTLACVYVQVDGRGRPDVVEFLSGWDGCCDEVRIDWRSVRRPASALVGIELHQCHGSRPARMRLVFDARRDAELLEALAEREALVVGTREFGRFANVVAAYGIDGTVLRAAVGSALAGTRHAVAS